MWIYDNAFTLNDLFFVKVSSDLGGGNAGDRGTHRVNAHCSVPMGYWKFRMGGGHSYFQSVASSSQDYFYQGNSHQKEI